MDQKQRDKIAWVLAVVLGLALIYLLAVNVFKVGERRTPPPAALPLAASGHMAPIQMGANVAPPPSIGAQVQSQAPEHTLDPKVLAEQQQIAARMPRRNPFSAAQASPATPVSQPVVFQSVEAAQPVNNAFTLKVAAIVSRPGSNKRIAMINGKMLEEGDRIGEWTILKVNPKNVVLGNGAQQKVVGVK